MEIQRFVEHALEKRPSRRDFLRIGLGFAASPLLAACGQDNPIPAATPTATETPVQAAPAVISTPERTPSPYDIPAIAEVAEVDADVRFLRANRNIQVANERLVQNGGQLVIVKIGLHKAQVQVPSLFSRYQPILIDQNLRDAGYPRRYPLEHNYHAYTREVINGNEISAQWVTAFYGGDGPQATSANASDVRFLAIGRSDEDYQPYMSITPISPIAPQLVELR